MVATWPTGLLAVLSAIFVNSCHAQAKVRLSGLQNCSTYDGAADFFVQIQDDGMRMTPSAESLNGVPLGKRVSDRVVATHNGWPLDFNSPTRQTDPGIHELDLKVVRFRGTELEPQTLLSQETFRSTSQSCELGAGDHLQQQMSCGDNGEQVPLASTASSLKMEVLRSKVRYTVLDEKRGETEWALPPHNIPSHQGIAHSLLDSRVPFASTLKKSFHRLFTPNIVPFAPATASSALPLVRIPVSVSHLWSTSHDFVRDNSVAYIRLSAAVSSGCLPFHHEKDAVAHTYSLSLRRGAGQAVLVLRGDELFASHWEWWMDAASSDCEVSLVAQLERACDSSVQVCSTLAYPGHATVRLEPFLPGLHHGTSTIKHAKWQPLPPQVNHSMSFGPKDDAAALLHALTGTIVVGEDAVLDIPPGSVLVLGSEVDVQVRGGGLLRIGTRLPQPLKPQTALADSDKLGVYVASTYICGVPMASGSVTWGGIYAVDYSSRIEVGQAQVIDSGHGWAGTWQHARAPGNPLQDAGPAHLQEKAVFDVRYGAEFAARDIVLHGRRGQAVIGIASTVTLTRVHIHGFIGGLQLADAAVAIYRCHFSHFFDQPSAMWGDIDQGKSVAYSSNDNDGMYVKGGSLKLRNTIIVGAGDDCFDSGTGPGGKVDIRGCWIEDCQHEGIALSNNGVGPKRVVVQDVVVAGCQQGLELGFSTQLLTVDVSRAAFVGNGIGLRVGDNYGWQTLGSVSCKGCVFARNARDVMSLHRHTCDSLPAHQLVLAGCLLETPSSLPFVTQLENHHGPSGKCRQLLGVVDEENDLCSSFAHNASRLLEDSCPDCPMPPGNGVSPYCRNAFWQHSKSIRFLGVEHLSHASTRRPGLSVGTSSSGAIENEVDQWSSKVQSWKLSEAFDGRAGNGVRRPPRARVSHGQAQQLADWDVSRRIDQHAREEAALGDGDPRRSTAYVQFAHLCVLTSFDLGLMCFWCGTRSEPGAGPNRTSEALSAVARSLQDLSWAVSDVHMFILWSSTPEVVLQEVISYLCSDLSGINVLGLWTVVPSGVDAATNRTSNKLGEDFFRRYYGPSYYSIFENRIQVEMRDHKGSGPFTVLIVEVNAASLCPLEPLCIPSIHSHFRRHM